MRRALIVVFALLFAIPISLAISKAGDQPERTTMETPQVMQLAQGLRETYSGNCAGSVTDSKNIMVCCTRGSRPVCYSDGRCNCRTDTYCMSTCKSDRDCPETRDNRCRPNSGW